MDASDNVLGSLIEASPDAIIVVDDKGKVQIATPAVRDLFGWEPSELVGHPVEVLIPIEVQRRHVGHRKGFTSSPKARPMGTELELHGLHKDGGSVPIDVSLVPVTVDNRPYVGAFVRDNSQRLRGEALLKAINELTQRLLAGCSRGEALSIVARNARELVEGSAAWIVVPSDDGQLVVVEANGAGAESFVGARLAMDSSLSGLAIAHAQLSHIEDMGADARVMPEARRLHFGPGMYVPMVAEEGSIGALVVAREQGASTFSDIESRATEAFAAATAVVLSLDTARQELQRLQIVAENERIARDLHDTVIQRLFALGMGLQGLQRLANGTVSERLDDAVGTVDGVIRQIRETIFDLNRPLGTEFRSQLRRIVAESRPQFGFAPQLTILGSVEAAVPDDMIPHLVAVSREALSNAARHSQAGQVELVLDVSDGWVSLKVLDDGIGIPDNPPVGDGLTNMADRARRLGGRLLLHQQEERGTVLEWRVPSTLR